MEDGHLIVQAKDLLRVQRYRRLWVLGWMVATAALVVAAFQTARLIEVERQAAEVRELTGTLAAVAARQEEIARNQLEVANQQESTSGLLISWGNYVRTRLALSQQNLNSPQFAPMKAPK